MCVTATLSLHTPCNHYSEPHIEFCTKALCVSKEITTKTLYRRTFCPTCVHESIFPSYSVHPENAFSPFRSFNRFNPFSSLSPLNPFSPEAPLGKINFKWDANRIAFSTKSFGWGIVGRLLVALFMICLVILVKVYFNQVLE
jgi:hypothetical protein